MGTPASPGVSDQPPAVVTVLLVDDNQELLDMLTPALTQLGRFRVVNALNGALGLEYAMRFLPDCIVIDVLMPELDGYQLVRALRGDPATAAIPLIMLTALAQERDRVLGLLAGVDQYLVKPVTLPDLVAAIHQAAGIHQDERVARLQALAEEDASPPETSGA